MKLFRTIETAANGDYKVGDVIAFTLNDGENVEALAVKQEDDGMIFYFVDALKKEYQMNPANSNYGDYDSCKLRKKLNGEILERFPSEIREKMIAFESGDLLRLATEREVFGENRFGKYEDENVHQWEPMKDRRNRIAFRGNKSEISEWYWLQNKSRDYASNFAIVYSDGNAGDNYASDAYGVRPAFKI